MAFIIIGISALSVAAWKITLPYRNARYQAYRNRWR